MRQSTSVRFDALSCIAVSLSLLAASRADAQAPPATGAVRGMFVLKGEAPLLQRPVMFKGPPICGPAPIPNEMLLLDPTTKGIENVFVWVRKIDLATIPENLRRPKDAMVLLDNRDCRFVPHCLVAHSDQTLVLLNDDPVAHNVHTNPLRPPAINDLVAPNDREGIKKPVGKAQILPIPVKCDIHPWMTGHILILDHNLAALSNVKGEFLIENLPAGEYDLKVWHEAGGYVLGARGLQRVTITAEETTDLGSIEIDVAKLRNLR